MALDNLVDFLVLCLEHQDAPGETFLLSDGEDLSTPELIIKIADQMGKSPKLMPVPIFLLRAVAILLGKKAESDRLCGSLSVDISKATRLLGWRPCVTVNEELKKTVSWYLQKISISH